MTHDVASPTMATNEEFTTWPKDDHSRYNDTLFHLRLMDSHSGASWKTKSGLFKLIHVPTKVAMWTFPGQLPDWAFSQQEVNGKKETNDKTTIWYVDDVLDNPGEFL
jgi:dolichyl-phosphate-mannose-protein mannosyltransferase